MGLRPCQQFRGDGPGPGSRPSEASPRQRVALTPDGPSRIDDHKGEGPARTRRGMANECEHGAAAPMATVEAPRQDCCVRYRCSLRHVASKLIC